MAENDETPVQRLQTGSIQEVVTMNKSLNEGLQNFDSLERKGHQTTDAPPPQSPPQTISAIFTHKEVLAAPPITPALEPVKEPPAQVSNTETAGES